MRGTVQEAMVPGSDLAVLLREVRVNDRLLWEVVIEHLPSGDWERPYRVRWATEAPARAAANRLWKRLAADPRRVAA